MSSPTPVTVHELDAFVREVPTRMPFRFGAATMIALRVAYLRARLEAADGRTARGVSAAVLSPLWFDKDESKSVEERALQLHLALRLGMDAMLAAGAGSAYDLHQRCEQEVVARGRALGLPELGAGFGVALVDGALVDGLCRLEETTLHAGLQADLFGFGPVPGLPARPLESLALRHTVGLLDPLVAVDVRDAVEDGLPETLEEVARTYGCTWFKIKLSGDVPESLARLEAVAEVLAREAPGYAVTLDANEQLADAEALEQLVRYAEERRALAELWSRTAWIEQPLARDAALDKAVAPVLARLNKPVVLDESDSRDGVVEEGLALGYLGVSAKNAKGVFRTLHSQRVIHEWNGRPGQDVPAVLTSEDLTAPSVVPLHQDLCVAAALGIPHTERNGHHYVRGLEALAEGEREAALEEFPTLYTRRGDGLVSLKVMGGRVSTAGIVSHGYGVRSEPDWDALAPLVLPDPLGA